MDLAEARDFLRTNHRAVMHTFRADGSPQLSPVIVAVDDDGNAMVSTRETSVKVRNLRRDARTSLCVFPDEFFGPWTRVDGHAEVISLPHALDPLVDYYRRVAGEHDDWDDYRSSMVREQRVLIRITLTGAGPRISG
jgi:PPOX class probable F420-dependent enzyme